MGNLIPVEGHNSLARDNDSKSIINTDRNLYNSYVNQRQRKLKEIEEIETLKSDVINIKKMLSIIIEKL